MDVYVMFFFVKQKTAYEMRISDWSSDVCSSDLTRQRKFEAAAGGVVEADRRFDPRPRKADLRRQAQHPDLAVAQRGARHQPPVAARRGIEEDQRRVIDRSRGARTQPEIDSKRHRAADPDIGSGTPAPDAPHVNPVRATQRPPPSH